MQLAYAFTEINWRLTERPLPRPAFSFTVCPMKDLARRFMRSILERVFALMLATACSTMAVAQVWTVLAFDAKDNGRNPRLPDAAQLAYRYDKDADILWFRICLYGAPDSSTEVTLAVDTGSTRAQRANWWGANKDFRFDKLVTAGTGFAGISDAPSANGATNAAKDEVQLRTEPDSILVGVKRTNLTDSMKFSVIAAVGSENEWNDDIPKLRPATIDLNAPRATTRIRELDFTRDNFRFPAAYRTLPDHGTPKIVERGHGPRTLVLIPGVYSGAGVFDGFMTRNAAKYKFVLITPPGLDDTPARAMPPEPVSYANSPWTCQLEHDVERFIRMRRLSRPVIMTHGFPGSLLAHDLAARHPELVSAVIDVSGIPVQPFPSPKDLTGKTPATPAERVMYVDEAWAKKWFKYVTAETWESNNYSAPMFADDPLRAEQIRKTVESNPLPVKIEYLTEFMAADQSDLLSKLSVPLLALRPGFSEQLLKDPATSWFKTMFQDPWDKFAGNPKIHIETIQNGHARLLDEDPASVDGMVDSFLAIHSQSDGNLPSSPHNQVNQGQGASRSRGDAQH